MVRVAAPGRRGRRTADDALTQALGRIVGADHVLTDADLRAGYEIDWTGAFRGVARAVVRPGTTEEVASVLAFCEGECLPVVPQGGNTGLVGGSVPDGSASALVISTRRLVDVGDVEPLSGQVTVGAGVVLSDFQARVPGFEVGVDFSARGSATVGGMVATNAGGMQVMRHGMTRHRLVGVEAVLPGGHVLSHLHGVEKDNTGYDLGGLLCGSEGTLGVITRVRWRLVRAPRFRVTALTGWPSVDAMVEGLATIRGAVPDLEVAEYMVRRGVELVMGAFGIPDPFPEPHAAYLLLEAAGVSDPSPAMFAALNECDDPDVAVAETPRERDGLWGLRDRHTEALAQAGTPLKLDVSVPLDRLAAFVDEVVPMVDAHDGLTCHHFGHLGDGNIHVNILGQPVGDVDDAVLRMVAERGGSISAEHGIGRLKRRWIGLARSAAELDAFAAVKGALDRRGIMNPGVVFDLSPRST